MGLRSGARADIGNNGRLDVFVTNVGDGNRLLRNGTIRSNNWLQWLQVEVEGVVSNRSGIGARITVISGGLAQIREVQAGTGDMTHRG
ncbi:MAG: hypothetical protein EA376_05860 [Phycisphaeraceae bacterium]|nr:MAG: hypothetical protein EA376_05860 [Phycisphaeraceae bacterium]